MADFTDRRVNLDLDAERRRMALESMAWTRVPPAWQTEPAHFQHERAEFPSTCPPCAVELDEPGDTSHTVP